MKTKLVIISDTHGLHEDLYNTFKIPDADVLIHCGDISNYGSENQLRKFLKWFGTIQTFEHKIFIAGNHDWIFERDHIWAKKLVDEYSEKYIENGEIHYLEDSGVELYGINFWGTPVSRPFCNWAFNRPEEKLKLHWEIIPSNTDVLITHTPPNSILDLSWSGSKDHSGSQTLHYEVFYRIMPQIHAFGHVHEQYGVEENNGIKFINASVLDHRYMVVNRPVEIEMEFDKQRNRRFGF